jgi:mannose-1-phosphate guanylyltransferase
VVELDARGVVTAFHEKSPDPPGNLANAAIFAMEAEVFDVVAEWPALDRAPDISLDIIPRFLGRVFSWLNSDYHRDIGTPESYAQAQKEFRMAGMPSRRTHE